MASLYCLRCESPVFRIISDVVNEYCCLRLACENFKISVRESATGISINSETISQPAPKDRPLFESHPHFPSIAELGSQSSRPKGSRAIRQRATAPIPQANYSEPPAGRADDAVEREDRERILQKPLSEQATEGADPVAETETWINRPAEERRREVPTNERVKRPHNAYILYRRAYTGAAHRLLGHTHQLVVVRLLSQSWLMESAAVRAKFFALAAMDKVMHQQAFPDYKYLDHIYSPTPA